MLKSMTGFGKAVRELQNRKVFVEAKTLNSKQLDINMKIPPLYREKEVEIRNEICRIVQRGKVDLLISYDYTENDRTSRINERVLKAYIEQLGFIARETGIYNQSDILSVAMRLPDVFSSEKEELLEEEWKQVSAAVTFALEQLDAFRSQEGEQLAKDITARIHLISQHAIEIKPFESRRMETIRERIQQSLVEVVPAESIDRNRFEQELIYYLERLDITEETVRLNNHCTYFLETMKEDQPGKKLGFIAQEIGREINTIGSKANDAEMQKIVVQMKDELEKIKEQLLNIF